MRILNGFTLILAAAMATTACNENRIGGAQLSTTMQSEGITYGPPTQLVFSVQPSTTQAANQIPVSVSVEDAFGNLVPSAVAVTLTYTDQLQVVHTFSATTTGGTAAFTSVSIAQAADNYILTAAASGFPSRNSAPFSITASAAATLSFSVQPQSIFAGSSFTKVVAVSVLDASGNIVTSSTTPITLGISTGGVLTGTLTKNAINGVATFLDMSSTKAGTGFSLTAASTGLTSATSTAFNVAPAAEASIAYLVEPPTTVVAGAPFSTPVQIELLDAYGNLATTSMVPITVTTFDGATPIATTQTLNPTNGIATTSTSEATLVGSNYTLVSNSTDLAPVTSTPFAVTAAAAAKLAFTTQPSTVPVNDPITPAVVVAVTDAFGNSTNSNVTMAIGTNSGGGTLAGTLTQASVSGSATFNNLSINAGGLGYTLSASITGFAVTSTAFNVNTVNMLGVSDEGACIVDNGTLQCFGFLPVATVNSMNQPAVTTAEFFLPTNLTNTSSLTNVQTVTGSTEAFCALINGGVQCWGNNSGDFSGELGNSTATDSLTPVPVSGLSSGVAQLVGGEFATFCALTTTGNVLCWGPTSESPTVVFDSTPTPFTVIPTGIKSLSANYGGFCALAPSNEVICWQFGAAEAPEINTTPQVITGISGTVTAVSGGPTSGCAIAGGGVYCWSSTANGQAFNTQAVAIPTLNSGVTSIAVSEYTACAVKNAGAFCWGSDIEGTYGNGTVINYIGGAPFNTVVTTTPVPVTGLGSGVTSVIVNDSTDCYAVVNGHLFAWGNAYGLGSTEGQALAQTSTPYSTVPIEVNGF